MRPAKTPSTRPLPRCAGIGLFMGGRRSSASSAPKAKWDSLERPFRFSFFFEHGLFGKPVSTFPDHALKAAGGSCLAYRRLPDVIEAGRPARGTAHRPWALA